MMRNFLGTVSNAFRQRGGIDPSFAVGLATGALAGVATAVLLPMAARSFGQWDPVDHYLTAAGAVSTATAVGALAAQVARFRANQCGALGYESEVRSLAVTALFGTFGLTAANLVMLAWPSAS